MLHCSGNTKDEDNSKVWWAEVRNGVLGTLLQQCWCRLVSWLAEHDGRGVPAHLQRDHSRCLLRGKSLWYMHERPQRHSTDPWTFC
jgi:hypothetical protein